MTRVRRTTAAVLVGVVPLLAACAAGSPGGRPADSASRTDGRPADPVSSAVTRSASPVHPPTTVAPGGNPSRHGISAVGALFPDGTGQPHSCTATVVASATGNVIMTAAHCVSGDATGTVFVPGYDSGSAPFGTWTVTGAYASDGWLAGTDENEDVAFLTVAPHGSTTVQQVTGAVALGTAPVDGEIVSITAYNIGIDDQPVHCATKIHDTEEQPTIFCGGFAGGSSGSAWVTTRDGTPTAVGIIGGLHQGGCVDWTSYSPPFDSTETDLLARVGGAGAVSDDLPTPPGDGCSS